MIIASLIIACLSILISIYSLIVRHQAKKNWKKVIKIYGQSK